MTPELETARTLRTAAALIMGSELAYPKEMRNSIMRKVREHYLKWLTFQFQQEVKKHTKTLAEAGGSVKFRFRISPALSAELEYYQEGTIQSLDAAQRRGEIADDVYKRLDKFFKTHKAADLQGIPPMELHWVIHALDMVKEYSDDRTATKAAWKLMDSLSKTMGGGPGKLEIEFAQDRLKQAESILAVLAPMVPGGKVKGPPARLADIEWKEDVDISDLPEQYRKMKQTLKWINVHFRVDKRVKKWSGSYSHRKFTLTLYIPTGLPGGTVKRVIDQNMAKIGETIEHELRHMVQNMLQDTYGKKAGTRLAVKEALPGWDPTQKMSHVSKDAYPNADVSERYYLGPKEFYPNLETAVFRFKKAFDGVLRQPTKDDFKIWVGLKPRGDNGVVWNYPFFMAYKKHDKPKYRKLLQEAWARLSDFVSARPTISVAQLLRAPEGAKVQTPKGTSYFTKQGDQWVMDNGSRSYDSKGLAQAIRGGDWVYMG